MLLFFIISSFFQKDIQQPSLSIFRSVFLVCRDNRSQTIIGNELQFDGHRIYRFQDAGSERGHSIVRNSIVSGHQPF